MTTVLIYGKFDILHAGHIRLFQYAKKIGDKLIIGLLDDQCANTEMRLDYETRCANLLSIKLIDDIFKFQDTDLLIEEIRPSIVLKGHEFTNRLNPEIETINSVGAKMVFMSGADSIRLTLNVEKNKKGLDTFARAYRQRYGISRSKVNKVLSQFSELRGLIIGDLIYDEYTSCLPVGMSQEDKNIVYETKETLRYVGGAGIVAAHCGSLGADIVFMTVVGDDELGNSSKEELSKFALTPEILIDPSRKTTTKRRYVWDEKSIFRASDLSTHFIDQNIEATIYESVLRKVDKLNFIILSDFNYGILSPNLVSKIITLCKSKEVCVVADCQTSSQSGDLYKYVGVDILTPTEVEVRVALNDFTSGLAYVGEKLFVKNKISNLIMTLGEEGLMIFNSMNSQIVVDRLGVLDVETVDSSGAGDSLLAISTLTFCKTRDIYLSSFMGTLAASIQVSRRGNTPLKISELKQQIDTLF